MARRSRRAAGSALGPVARVALEQALPRHKRLIHDDLAYRLLPAAARALVALLRTGPLRHLLPAAEDRRVPGITGGLLCRKRYIEGRLREALQGDVRSVVVLGAGFDTLAYRVPELASIRVFEVDLPQNVQAKRGSLQRLFGSVPEHVRLVPIDFDSQDPGEMLRQAGFTPAGPSFFIWEGVTQYISEAAVKATFSFLQSAGAGSRLVFTYIRQDFVDGREMYGLESLHRMTRGEGRLWKFGLEPEEVAPFLEGYGWRVLDHVGSAEYEERYLRPNGREMPVMEIERAVYAERAAG